MSSREHISPRTFYLNEQHELSRAEKEGGGSVPKYTDINWASKGAAIARSLSGVRTKIQESSDPAKNNHYFLLAAPVEQLAKSSTDKRKAIDGRVFERTDFAEKHSRVFRRLGLDLVSVAEDGSAVVHMKPETMEQLTNTAHSLADLGPREKSRWATISAFQAIPSDLRIDSEWLDTLQRKKPTDAVIEFQPLLMRSEIDALVRAVVSILLSNLGEALTGTGTDFSGRQWVRGRITRESLKKVSESFFSVESLHSPLISKVASSQPAKYRRRGTQPEEMDPSSLPIIGVIDTGVPADHIILSRYRRGRYVFPQSVGAPANPHGCFVSSRVVFGDPDYASGLPTQTPLGTARYYDINVSGSVSGDIEGKSVYPALQAVVGTAPDVRVFNMSFDDSPLDQITPVKRAESLKLVQDLDNFIFQNDILVVVAAGNSPPGILPSPDYPQHFIHPQWRLGPWARSFNSLTCGSYVAHLNPSGLVNKVGWPSPFCRAGPGLCDSFKPDFSASGGNATPSYQAAVGLGVWGLSPTGMWEDQAGTSFAAPLLAREAVFAMQRLQKVCERGAEPFGVTVKAFLALTATPPIQDAAITELVERTLGRGVASAGRLESASAATGVMIWQGVLEDEKDVARIQIPIPVTWLREADEPFLRLVVSWDPPANAAAKHLWSTRDVIVRLRMHPDVQAQRPTNVRARGSYPMIERRYSLRKLPPNVEVEGDSWLLEISYDQIAEYHPGMSFPPQQRVAFAAELFDGGKKRLSPQSALQSLPATKTMTRLTIPPTVSRLPIVLKTPI